VIGVCCAAGCFALVQLDGSNPVRITINAVKNFVSHMLLQKASVAPFLAEVADK